MADELPAEAPPCHQQSLASMLDFWVPVMQDVFHQCKVGEYMQQLDISGPEIFPTVTYKKIRFKQIYTISLSLSIDSLVLHVPMTKTKILPKRQPIECDERSRRRTGYVFIQKQRLGPHSPQAALWKLGNSFIWVWVINRYPKWSPG